MSNDEEKINKENANNDKSVWTEGPEVAGSTSPTPEPVVANATTESPMPPPAATVADMKASENREPANWERDLIGRLSFATLAEQRRGRRWGIFFKFLTFVYLFSLLFMFLPKDDSTLSVSGVSVGKKHTALIEVEGVIAPDAEANADNIITSLRNAFKDSNTAGIIVRINSPGGSPVQAGYVNDEIRRLKAQHPNIPLYAVVTDICASGGYYIAAAADEIYADKASLVGSIGVLMDGYGFVGTIEKLGVERRLLTAGENKGFLDPFSPLKPSDVEHVKSLLGSTHQQFIKVVKEGRGDRLKNDPQIFSGLIWTGEQGLSLGLIDGLGSSSYVARDIIGAEKIVDFTRHPHPFERFADRLGVSMASFLTKSLGLQGQVLR